MIQFQNISFRRGSELLIEDASLQIHPGQRVGITGRNGCGKSTLFALLKNEHHLDQGDIRIPADWVIASVAQQTPSGEEPALTFVIDGDHELRAIEQQLEVAQQTNDGMHHAELLARYEQAGGYSAHSRAARILDGLGFTQREFDLPVNHFSGGWRMRLALARTLMSRSDLLLLDEPTNHLDLDAVMWLSSWLAAYPGTLLLISHDREVLDQVTNHTLYFEHKKMRLYTGNYSSFERQHAEQLAQQQAGYEHQQKQIAHLQKFVDRFRAKASKSRQAQSRLKALERMPLIAAAQIDSPFSFQFATPVELPRSLLQLNHATVGYDDTPILQDVSLALVPGDRLGLLGPNGAGKSTLIKALACKLRLQNGELTPAKHLQVGYFAQHQIEQLREDESPLQHLQRQHPESSEQELRKYLGGFGFQGDSALKAVGPFSGGEKARLALALIIRTRPNLLLLDEPTNHLDMQMREALAQALQDFAGAMVIISHDRHLLNMTVDRLLLVHAGHANEFSGTLQDYYSWLESQRRSNAPSEAPKPTTQAEPVTERKKDQRRESARLREQLQPLRTQERDLSKEITNLTTQLHDIANKLNDQTLYESAMRLELEEILRTQHQLKEKLQHAEEKWLEVSTELEQILNAQA